MEKAEIHFKRLKPQRIGINFNRLFCTQTDAVYHWTKSLKDASKHLCLLKKKQTIVHTTASKRVVFKATSEEIKINMKYTDLMEAEEVI